ncbi:MAG: PKD domain-containing protein [Saprospiraceae bacterium]
MKMNFKLLYIILLSFSSALFAQNFNSTRIENRSNKLSQKFINYEVLNLDVAQLQTSLNKDNNVHSIKLSGKTFNWDLILTEFNLLKYNFILIQGLDNGIKKSGDQFHIKTYKVLSMSKNTGPSCLTIADNFVYGFVEESGVKTYIEPLKYYISNAAQNEFIIYKEQDVLYSTSIKCAVEDNKDIKIQLPKKSNSSQVQQGCISVDIAIACDYTIFVAKGGLAGSDAFVVGVLNNVQTNYDDEFPISIELNVSAVFIATSVASDPWANVIDIDTHLQVHKTWGNGGGYGGANYAVATAWTTKYQGTFGLAFVGGVCGVERYNVCSDFGGSSGLLRNLQAHELGHNFNAIHDGAGSGYIMAPTVSNSTTWSKSSISSINNFIKTLGCVTVCSGPEAPIIDFSLSQSEVCPNTLVQFKDESFGFPISWKWTFTGGTPSISTLQNPTVQYKSPGFYDVTLQATNQFGSNSKTITKIIEIKPVVANSFTTYTISKVLFTVNNCVDADSYIWYFGDTTISTEDQPMHTYSKDGMYTVKLCATNDCGTICKDSKVIVSSIPIAGFKAAKTEICAGDSLRFTNLSSSNVSEWEWHFEGAKPNFSSNSNPIVLFEKPGLFTINLVVRNAAGEDSIVKPAYIFVKSAVLCTKRPKTHERPVDNGEGN